MIRVVDRLAGHETFEALLARIRESAPAGGAPGGQDTGAPAGGPPPSRTGRAEAVCAEGLWGSFGAVLAGAVAARLRRPLLFVTAHLEQADEARDDLELFCGQSPELFSAFETLPGEGAASDEIHAERLRLLTRLDESRRRGDPETDLIVVAPVQALMQAVPSFEALEENLLALGVGERRDPRRLVEWLVEHGFTRLDQVESPGDFALRGDILDIWAPGEVEPYR
ncbi:MAG: hypothetical protein HRF43_00190, partial [Phycisphaerae bacterium]